MAATRTSRRVGLEISNSAVRIAEVVTGSGGKARVVKLGQVRLPSHAVVDGGIVDVPAVTVAIERCIKEGDFNIKNVHLGVAGLRAITRELDMPYVSDAELDSAVRLQALDVIPFPTEKTVVAARPLEDLTGPDGSRMRRVLLAAVHRDLVEPLLEAVEGAGLTAVSIDLTSTAMIRSLCNLSGDDAVTDAVPEAIVAIGAGLTTVIVHEGGVPHFVRTIAQGGDAVTAAIAGAIDLPIDDAESMKRNLDQPGPKIRAAIAAAEDASTPLVGEIRSSIEYYSTLPGRAEIRRVTLTGGGSRLNGLLERLQNNLRAEVIPGDALSRVDCTELDLSDEETMRREALVSVVLGLALPEPAGVKPLDLLPPEIVKHRKAARTDRIVVTAAMLIVVALVGLGLMKYLTVHTAENAVGQVRTQITATQVRISKYDLVAKDYNQIVSQQAELSPLVTHEVNWPLVLSVLARNTPAGGIVTGFSGAATPPVTAAAAPAAPAAGATTTAAQAPAVVPLQDQQIGSLALTIYTPRNLPYFQIWVNKLVKSQKLQVTSWSAFVTGTGGEITYSAVVSVLGTIGSSRLKEFEVIK